MKTLRIVCPTCGAQLDVDMATGQARCRFCKEIFSLGDEPSQTSVFVDDMAGSAEQMGYDFERGRQRANVEFTQGFADRVAEARKHMPAMDPEPVYVPQPVFVEPEPARVPARGDVIPIWLVVLLWLVFPPAGLFATVFMLVSRARMSAQAGAAPIIAFVAFIPVLLALFGLLAFLY